MSKKYNDAVVSIITDPRNTISIVRHNLPKGAKLVKREERRGELFERVIVRCKSKGRTGAGIRQKIAGRTIRVLDK